jgi:hypothetical protein
MPNTPSKPDINCPVPAPENTGFFTSQQSQLNVTRQDKFILVMTIPDILKPILKKENRVCNGGNLERLEMSIWGFVVPELQINKIQIPYSGQTLKFSGHSRPSVPTVSVNYTVDNRFDNYYILYKWLDIQNDEIYSQFDYKGMNPESRGHLCDYATTFTVYAIDEYNKPTAKWDYIGAFPTILGAVNANYRDSKEMESTFSFDCSQIKMSLL